MGMAPITDDERELVRRLHAQGMGRNAITRETRIHNKRVSAIAADLGLSFSRAGATAVATEAKKADAASRRARLQVDALEAAERLLGQMFASAKVYNIGGKENTYTEHTMDEPPFRDKRDIAVSLQALTATAIRLAEFDKGANVGAAKSMLGALAAGLGQAYEQLQNADQAEQGNSDAD